MAARVPWVFYDPTTLTTEYMEVNPNSGASPDYKKNVVKKATVGPAGQVVIFEGNDEPMSFPFSGVILTETQYNFLLDAYNKRHLLQITDDLGRAWVVYITSFSPKRKISRSYPWRHDYSAEAVIVS